MVSPINPVLPKAQAPRKKWSGLHGSSKALALISAVEKAQKTMVIFTKDMDNVYQLSKQLKFYSSNPSIPIINFPDWETLPYDLFSPYQDILSQRLDTLYQLGNMQYGIVIVSMTTAMQRLLPKDYLMANSLLLTTKQLIDSHALREQLVQQGYRIVQQVDQHGEIACRGSLMDIFPMGSEQPYRIDFLDDTIDSIRVFDYETQRSLKKVDNIKLLPAHEIALTQQGIEQFCWGWQQKFTTTENSIYQDVNNFITPAGIEYYLPLFYEHTHNLLDYVPDDTIIVLDEDVKTVADVFFNYVTERYEQCYQNEQRLILAPLDIYLNQHEWLSAIKPFLQIHIANLTEHNDNQTVRYDTKFLPPLKANVHDQKPFKLFEDFIHQFNGRILLLAESIGRQEIILDMLSSFIKPKVLNNWSTFLQEQDSIALTISDIEIGLQMTEPNITVITESQLFGHHAKQPRKRNRKDNSDAIIRNLTEINIGMPVVHEMHGVGRYHGLVTLDSGGVLAEFLHLEYADGDKLYVPVLKFNVISRYTGVDVEHAPLHKLGSGQWLKSKRKAAIKIHDVAAELLELHARRARRQGYSFNINQDAYSNFVQGFIFEETPDQRDAILDVIEDMSLPKPMDRLICGDAGFGKTEVAMRAAFIAVYNNKQVALLVPTTLLAQQHFQSFNNRFVEHGVHVDILSRFKNQKESDRSIKDLAAGKVDIIIGTHKLLQKNISFKNLGLVIIDEEHRFGVRQKEKFKALRSEVDVLTLTATPIPRTLNMAFSELRELSIITTPPSRRLAVKTFVSEWNDDLMVEAISREIKRGGQVFFIHNQVKTIAQTKKNLQAIVPEARIELAHGKLPERELESVMSDFYHRIFNVLVCTTIIETGIDIPSANTIIIHRADKFGLAQLYQLRGRVGRSHHCAYAYLIIPPKQQITDDAYKRLDAITSMEDLGVGFTLATHDLEIRGAGEVLGENQSGQMREIGFTLYMELLNRTVEALRSGQQVELDRPLDHGAEIDLHIPSLIPEDYVPDVGMRLILYKRIANAKDHEDIDDLKKEIIDRFGIFPEPIKNLFRIISLKIKAKQIGIRKIDINAHGGQIYFADQVHVEPTHIIKLVQSDPTTYRLNGGDKIRISSDLADIESRFVILDTFLNKINLSP